MRLFSIFVLSLGLATSAIGELIAPELTVKLAIADTRKNDLTGFLASFNLVDVALDEKHALQPQALVRLLNSIDLKAVEFAQNHYTMGDELIVIKMISPVSLTFDLRRTPTGPHIKPQFTYRISAVRQERATREQGDALQPTTAPESKAEGKDDPKTEPPPIIFDGRPEAGVPPEASSQEPDSDDGGDVKMFHRLVDRAIKTVRIRYFNRESWGTEEEAKKYLSGFFAHESQQVFDQQISSKIVPSVPEIECIIEFTEDHLLREKQRNSHREGRLLIWKTEACYRDATGRWWFVDISDHFYGVHPRGKLANEATPEQGEQDGAYQPATAPESKPPRGKEKSESEAEAPPPVAGGRPLTFCQENLRL